VNFILSRFTRFAFGDAIALLGFKKKAIALLGFKKKAIAV